MAGVLDCVGIFIIIMLVFGIASFCTRDTGTTPAGPYKFGHLPETLEEEK